jgi:hypothetical protein
METIINSKTELFYDYITPNNINNLNEYYWIYQIMKAIINNKTERFYDLITQDNINEISPSMRGDIMIAIIKSKEIKLYKHIQNNINNNKLINW